MQFLERALMDTIVLIVFCLAVGGSICPYFVGCSLCIEWGDKTIVHVCETVNQNSSKSQHDTDRGIQNTKEASIS